MEHTHTDSPGNISLAGQEVITVVENRGAIQRIPHKLGDWVDRNFVTVNRDKFEVLQVAQDNPCNNTDLGLMSAGNDCGYQQPEDSVVGPSDNEGQPHKRLLHWVWLGWS